MMNMNFYMPTKVISGKDCILNNKGLFKLGKSCMIVTGASSAIKSGRCVKTVRFENSIDIENIKAKFKNGTVTITLPKLIIPKHKVTVD